MKYLTCPALLTITEMMESDISAGLSLTLHDKLLTHVILTVSLGASRVSFDNVSALCSSVEWFILYPCTSQPPNL